MLVTKKTSWMISSPVCFKSPKGGHLPVWSHGTRWITYKRKLISVFWTTMAPIYIIFPLSQRTAPSNQMADSAWKATFSNGKTQDVDWLCHICSSLKTSLSCKLISTERSWYCHQYWEYSEITLKSFSGLASSEWLTVMLVKRRLKNIEGVSRSSSAEFWPYIRVVQRSMWWLTFADLSKRSRSGLNGEIPS